MDSDPNSSPSEQPKYWAFISYSQRDAQWGRWLHAALERYRIPRPLVGRNTGKFVVPRRLFPVFRDRDELPSAADLGQKIQEALRASRSLVVICSPHAAASRWVDEEIRSFKALGGGDRVFPLIVDGEPYASERPGLGAPECFPPSLRFQLTPDGTLTDRRAEPLAADAREGQDGRDNARLKIIAGILNVSFDELRQRERVRQRRQRWWLASAAVATFAALALIYLGLADAEFAVPGNTEIQLSIDRCECSVFRRIPTAAEIADAAANARNRIRQQVIAEVERGGLPQGKDGSVWTVAQIASAVFRDPNAGPSDFQRIAPLVRRYFAGDMYNVSDGKRVGWHDMDLLPRVEPALWTLMALATALGRGDMLTPADRQAFLGYLDIAQDIAEVYYPLRDGGWNAIPQSKPEHHYTYAATLALHALLELRSAGLCWRGNCDTLQQMIAATSLLLIKTFLNDRGVVGWRMTDDLTLPPSSDLNVMIYGALERAQQEAGIAVPDQIRSAAIVQLIDLRQRPYNPSYREVFSEESIADAQGQLRRVTTIARAMWYPWTADALVTVLKPERKAQLPFHQQRALERSLGHLMFDISGAMLGDALTAPPWIQGETYYGLGRVR